MKYLKRIVNRIITTLLRGLGVIAYRLSVRGRTQMGRFAGNVLRRLSKRRWELTLDNLRSAFPECSEAWYRNIARESYRNLGITLIELLTFPYLTPNEVRQMITLTELDIVEAAHNAGRGILFVSGHFGNWELLAFAFPLYTNIPTSVIVAAQSNPFAEKYLQWYRSRTGNQMILMDKAARTIVQRVRAGEAIALLADQAATSDRDVFVPFFGRLASTYEAPAAICLKFDVPMFVVFAERGEDGRYTAKFRQIPHDDLASTRDGITELTRRHVAALEETIRQRPELWSWQHRRWKHEARG
jgi:Kdo2-lipid IVA lauroyltransferase/acyltransferase